jgi:hypothetical protein
MAAARCGRDPEDSGRVDFVVVCTAERAVIEGRRDALGLPCVDDSPADARADDLHQGGGMIGLALSGGGIRSATFCLGILQYFARRDLLKHVDYLSTVSGGGYIGSSLTWFLNGRPDLRACGSPAVLGAKFPYGVDSADRRVPLPRKPNENLEYLRGRGRYLTPGKGVTILSAIAVALRGMALNLLVWAPLVTGLFLLLFWLKEPTPVSWSDLAAGALHHAWAMPWFSGEGWRATLDQLAGVGCTLERLSDRVAFPRAFDVVGWILGAFLAASVTYSIGTYGGFDHLPPQWSDRLRYYARRLFEKASRCLLAAAAVLAIIGSIPLAARYLGGALSGGVLLSGVASGVAMYLKSRLHVEANRLPIGRLAPIAALLLLYGFGLVSYIAAVAVYDDGAPPHLRQIYAHLFLAAIVTGIVVNINLTSLHRFYRDRLMEAFLPDAAKGCGGMSLAAETGYLCDMVDHTAPRGPYHLINTHFIVTNTEDPKLKLRGGDSFILSPQFCGSAATGWRGTKAFLGRLTLATAMAISGAAANPNAGVGGTGVTRNVAVALVMALLNMRLGYWVPNPALRRRRLRHCNHFWPGLAAAFAWMVDADDRRRPWLQLSDGGHFDNTGLYELVRRRVRLILFCDGSADPDFKFEDLHNAIDRVYKDFGVVVAFDHVAGLDAIMPAAEPDRLYPAGIKLSRRPYALATIRYPAAEDGQPGFNGLLVVMTTALTRKASLALLAHKDVTPAFPDESTMDQFFEEGQFEAYRELGWNVAWQTVNGLAIRSAGGYLRIPAYDENRGHSVYPVE